MISVYTLPVCPNCDDLKNKLKSKGLVFDEYDLEDSDVRLSLLMESVTLVDAPIVKINDVYFNSSDAMKELNLW